jgi:hypothetical protein
MALRLSQQLEAGGFVSCWALLPAAQRRTVCCCSKAFATLLCAMARLAGKTRIVTPDGVEWTVGRRWMSRTARRSWATRRQAGGELLTSAPLPGGDWAGGGLEGAVLIIAGVLVVALVLLPVLLFGIELIIVGCVLAASLAGRILLGRPWTIEARIVRPAGSERQLEWSVPGWRRSGKVIGEIAQELAAGRDPTPQARQLL